MLVVYLHEIFTSINKIKCIIFHHILACYYIYSSDKCLLFRVAGKGYIKLRPLSVSNKKACKLNAQSCVERPHKNFGKEKLPSHSL